MGIITGKQSIRKNICTWNFWFNTLEERKLIDMEIKLKEIDKDAFHTAFPVAYVYDT